ncbi:MAG: hypothetical protein HZA54_07205 [Planctomycetes bacterium]|nr:hypothetical protein [Planctomycetota bacterium]
MRRRLGWFVLGLCLLLPLRILLSDDLTLDDVIVMAMTGVPEEQILEEIRAGGMHFNLTDADLARLAEAKVSARVITALKATARAPEPAGPRLVAWSLPDGRIGFSYPETWKPISARWGMPTIASNAFEVAVVPRAEPDDLSELRTGFLLAYYREVWIHGRPSLEDWETAYRQRLEQTDPGMTLSRAGSRTVAGREGMMFDLSGTPMGASAPVRALYWVAADPGGVYLLGGSAPRDDYADLAPTFERIFASVRFGVGAAADPVKPGSGAGGAGGTTAAGGTGTGNPPGAGGAGGAGTAGTPPTELPSFLEFIDPDRTFSIRYPAGWARSNLVTPDGIYWFFAKERFDPRAGKPFVNGISVFLRPHRDTATREPGALARVAEEWKGYFLKTQLQLGSTLSLGDAEPVKLGGGGAAVRYMYNLRYSDGREERGVLLVSYNRRAVIVVEGNTLKDDFAAASPVLLTSAQSLRVEVGTGNDRR